MLGPDDLGGAGWMKFLNCLGLVGRAQWALCSGWAWLPRSTIFSPTGGDSLINGGEALYGLRGLWVLGEGAANRHGWWLC
jgi:hypothetical protein